MTPKVSSVKLALLGLPAACLCFAFVQGCSPQGVSQGPSEVPPATMSDSVPDRAGFVPTSGAFLSDEVVEEVAFVMMSGMSNVERQDGFSRTFPPTAAIINGLLIFQIEDSYFYAVRGESGLTPFASTLSPVEVVLTKSDQGVRLEANGSIVFEDGNFNILSNGYKFKSNGATRPWSGAIGCFRVKYQGNEDYASVVPEQSWERHMPRLS